MQLARELGSFGGVAGEASNLSHVERRLGNLARAEELALEALQISNRRGDEWLIPYVLSALAATAAEGQKFQRAAQLLGAATRMMDEQGAAWPPDEAPLFAQTREAASQALGSFEFNAAWARGRAMPSREAVAYALAAQASGPGGQIGDVMFCAAR
jgi:non-specific serine/threonine protein kinase